MESRKRERKSCRAEVQCFKEEGDIVREQKAVHEDIFLSSERKLEVDREAKEGVSEKRIREEEKGENETLIVKRRCVNSVSTDAFDMESCGNSWGDLWYDPGGLSDGDPGDWAGVLVVLAVMDVHVHVSQSSSFSKQRSFVGWILKKR